MTSDELKVSVTVRIPISLVQVLDLDVKDKKFRDRSEAIITLILDGKQLNRIITMIKDPKQVKKAIKKIQKMETFNNMKSSLKKFEPHELSLIAKLAKILEEEKVQQTYLDMKA